MKFKDLSSQSPKNFLKLEAGQSIKGVLRGEISDFRQHWSDNRSSICPGRDKCDLCKAGEKSAFRFRVNFIISENGAFVAKTLDQGKALYEQLRILSEDTDLEHHMVKITRIGKGKETTYMANPFPNGILTKEQELIIKDVPLNVLIDATNKVVEEDPDIAF